MSDKNIDKNIDKRDMGHMNKFLLIFYNSCPHEKKYLFEILGN